MDTINTLPNHPDTEATLEFGLEVGEPISSKSLREVATHLSRGGYGEPRNPSSLGSFVTKLVLQFSDTPIVAEHFDGNNERFIVSSLLPSPVSYEIHDETKINLEKTAKSHIIVRSAITHFMVRAKTGDDYALRSFVDSMLMESLTTPTTMRYTGRKAHFEDIIAHNPNLLGNNLGIHSRFDVVISSDGKDYYFVDYAPKSGGTTWIPAHGMIHSAKSGENFQDYFDYDAFVDKLQKGLSQIGLEPEDGVLFVGGSGRGHAIDVDHLNGAGLNMMRTPVERSFEPNDAEDPLTYFKQLNILGPDESGFGIWVENKQGEQQLIKALYFAHGFEHFKDDKSIENKNIFQLLEYASKGQVRMLNHPFTLDMAENKYFISLLQNDAAFLGHIYRTLVEELGLAENEAKEHLQAVLATTPYSYPLYVKKNRKGSVRHSVYDTNVAIKDETSRFAGSPELVLENSIEDVKNFFREHPEILINLRVAGGGRIIVKSGGGYGARDVAILEGDTADDLIENIHRYIVSSESSVDALVLQQFIDPLRIPDIDVMQYMETGEINITGTSVPRMEYFFSHVGDKVQTAGISMTTMPSKNGVEDAIAHGGLTAQRTLIKRKNHG